MKNIILKVNLLLLFSTALLACNFGNNTGFKTPAATTSHKLNIQNGTAVTDPNLNGMIPLIYRKDTVVGGSICTGTLLSPDVVLTAAHCVIKMPPKKINEPYTKKEVADLKDVYVILSKDLNRPVNIYKDSPGNWNTYQGKEIYVHKDAFKGVSVESDGLKFDSLKQLNKLSDTAIIKLNAPVDSQYKFAQLATQNPRIGTSEVIAGYGVDNGPGVITPSLNGILGVLRAAISEVYYAIPSSSFIAVGETIESQVGYTKTCQGDSGGPDLIYDAVINQYTITGIHSVGVGGGCGAFETPTISMSVAYYLDWIESGYLINHL